jgi:hypothetical protein
LWTYYMLLLSLKENSRSTLDKGNHLAIQTPEGRTFWIIRIIQVKANRQIGKYHRPWGHIIL